VESNIKEEDEEEFIQLSTEYIHHSEKNGTDPFCLQQSEFTQSDLVKVESSAENVGLNKQGIVVDNYHFVGRSIRQGMVGNENEENADSEVTISTCNNINKPGKHGVVTSKLKLVVPSSGQGTSRTDGEIMSRTIPKVASNDRSCSVCSRKFVHKRDLENHMSIHTGEKPFSCNYCDKKFRLKDLLKRHEMCHNGDMPQCHLCGGRFVQLRSHLKNIHFATSYEYFCSVCKKAFCKDTNLRQHMLTHTDERPYTCQDCGSRFHRKNQLICHMVTHTKEKNHTCTVCGKKFARRDGIKNHMRVHTGVKPYCCETCGRAFKRTEALRNHQLIHTSEKPLVCSTCGKRFRQIAGLTRHILIHSGEQPFECSECGMKFNQSSSMQRHKLTHTGEKPYSCSDCGQRFTQSGGLCSHRRKHCSARKTQT